MNDSLAIHINLNAHLKRFFFLLNCTVLIIEKIRFRSLIINTLWLKPCWFSVFFYFFIFIKVPVPCTHHYFTINVFQCQLFYFNLKTIVLYSNKQLIFFFSNFFVEKQLIWSKLGIHLSLSLAFFQCSSCATHLVYNQLYINQPHWFIVLCNGYNNFSLVAYVPISLLIDHSKSIRLMHPY